MTATQRQMLIELRGQGMSYLKIADATGLSRDSVRNYCKRHGMAGYGKNVLVADGITCPQCGGKIQQGTRGRKNKFCSEKCRRQWWRKHPAAAKHFDKAYYDLVCQSCGKTFTVYGNKHRKYCSR